MFKSIGRGDLSKSGMRQRVGASIFRHQEMGITPDRGVNRLRDAQVEPCCLYGEKQRTAKPDVKKKAPRIESTYWLATKQL